MLKRPKRGESEDELLKFQEEFLASQHKKPSALVKKADKRKSDGSDKKDVVQLESLPSTIPSEPAIPVKKSKFRKAREEASHASPNCDAEENIEKHDRHMAQVLSHIIERDTRNAAVFLPRQATQGFPSAMHRGTMAKESPEPGKKKSLFAQHLAMSGARDFGVVLHQEMQKVGEVPLAPYSESAHSGDGDVPSRSRIVHGTGLSATLGMEEAKKIHEENVEKLAEMSEDEILEERRKLLEMMDPKLVEFLTAKKKSLTETQAMETGMETEDSPHNVCNLKKKKKLKNPDMPNLPLEPSTRWVNMDKVEYDKLEWMKDLPPPKPADSKSGVAARFDFQGRLLPADSDIPVHIGLHHHGVEPERAGYTLEELFQLARSSNNQQRTLALQVLARIINKAKCGAYVDLIQTPIVPSILESGVVFLFRWAMDDSVDSVLSAAVAAMHALICNQDDQNCLRFTFSWYQGHIMAGQCPVTMETERQDGDESVEETDAEVANRDVVLALVTRMVFLQRLRHILEIRRPQAVTVVQILETLTKIAQHSPSMAYEIIHCPGLLDQIFKDFLPTSWSPADEDTPMSNVYGYPLTAALRLVSSLCQAGRNMAAHLISKYNLQDILLRYMAVKTSDMQLPPLEAELIQTESFDMWRVCLSYSLTTQVYLDLYSTLVSHIQSVQQHFMGQTTKRNQPALKEAAMFACCETVLNVAGTSRRQAGFMKSQDGSSMETESNEEVISPDLNWSHVAGLVQPITSCVQCMLKNIQENYQFKKHDLHIETSCINFLTSFYSQMENQAGYNPVACLQDVENFCENHIIPFWKSLGFKSVMGNLSFHSNLLSAPKVVSAEVAPTIVELQSSLTAQDFINPVSRYNSPIGFITAILRLIHVFCKLHKGIIDKMLDIVTQDEDLIGYMRNISQNNKSCLTDNYFTRFENYLQYYFLKLVTLKLREIFSRLEPGLHMSVLHRCGLHLLARLQDGDEHLVHDLLSTVVFNPDFIPDSKETDTACDHLEELTLSDTSRLKSATQEEINAGRAQLLHNAHTKLPSIRSTYITAFSGHQQALVISRHRLLPVPLETKSLMTRTVGQAILPLDWMYLPLIELYSRASQPGSKLQEGVPPHLVAMVSDVLHWVYMLECWRPNILGTVSITLKMSRVMCAFMAGNDLFLNKSVSSFLVALLREYTKPQNLDHLDFTETIPGLTSFYDLFEELLQQFESVSFGDSVFACYVLVALQRKHSVQMRRLVWGEKAGVLRILRVPLSEVVIPLERFLEPDESDLPLLKLYFQCLLAQTVRPTWSPLLYLTAVHHVNRFIYYHGNQEHQAVKEIMWIQLLKSKVEQVKKHILYYKSAHVGREFGMVLYSDLPPIRKTVLDKMRTASTQR